MDEEAKSLVDFLLEQGHSNPTVLVHTADNPDVEDWSSGYLEVWSKDDCFIPFIWEGITVQHNKTSLEDELAAGESDDN